MADAAQIILHNVSLKSVLARFDGLNLSFAKMKYGIVGANGIGKTTFLDYYFNSKESEFSKNYNVFHLYPVNYSVLQNEDIFSYLKLLGKIIKNYQSFI